MTNDALLFLAQVEAVETKLLVAPAEETQAERLAVNGGNCRDAHIDLLIVGVQIHPPVLRQAPLGNVHVRHHFQARDDGGLQQTDRKSTRLNSSHGYISYA